MKTNKKGRRQKHARENTQLSFFSLYGQLPMSVQQRSIGKMEFRGVLEDYLKYYIIFLDVVMFMVASAS